MNFNMRISHSSRLSGDMSLFCRGPHKFLDPMMYIACLFFLVILVLSVKCF